MIKLVKLDNGKIDDILKGMTLNRHLIIFSETLEGKEGDNEIVERLNSQLLRRHVGRTIFEVNGNFGPDLQSFLDKNYPERYGFKLSVVVPLDRGHRNGFWVSGKMKKKMIGDSLYLIGNDFTFTMIEIHEPSIVNPKLYRYTDNIVSLKLDSLTGEMTYNLEKKESHSSYVWLHPEGLKEKIFKSLTEEQQIRYLKDIERCITQIDFQRIRSLEPLTSHSQKTEDVEKTVKNFELVKKSTQRKYKNGQKTEPNSMKQLDMFDDVVVKDVTVSFK